MTKNKRSAEADTNIEQNAKKLKKVTIVEPSKTKLDSSSKDTQRKTKSFVSNAKQKPFAGKTRQDFSKGNEAPPDWVQFKQKKKEVRAARKQSKNLYDVVCEAKKIGENLRRKNLKGGKVERIKLATELHELLGRKGNYVKFVVSHDMARIVQHLLKFGTPQIREEVAQELIPAAMTLIQSKYAKFCVERMFKYGSAETRSSLITACYGSAVKLCSHVVSAHILANAYSTWATPTQKQYLQQEFYGDMYKQSKDVKVKCIADVYNVSPDMKIATLSAVKANLSRVLNKELLDNQLVHAVIADYMSVVTEEADRIEMITSLSSHAVVLANTKEGARIVMNCIWHGSNKDRKTIMKAVKEHIKDLCCHEQAHAVIIAILDSVDDTVLINKILLGEIISYATDLALNEWGRKVLLWLIAPSDPHHFHPTFIKELKQGLDSATCKKEPQVRREQLIGYASSSLLKKICEEPNKWLQSASVAMLTLAIIKSDPKNSELESTLNSIACHVCKPDWVINEKADDNDQLKQVVGIEHAGMHMILKKLAQHDKVLIQQSSPLFGTALVSNLTDTTIRRWAETNRACFVLVAVIESSSDETKTKLLGLLKTHKKILSKQTSAGSKILLKKL